MPTINKPFIASGSLYLLRWSFLLYVLFLPYFKTLEEAFAIISAICLGAYYWTAYSDSNLRRFKLSWTFYLLWLWIICKTIFSIHHSSSIYALKSSFYIGPTLFLTGLEAIRSFKDLRHTIYTFAFASAAQGLDGIWQYYTGFDFVHNTPRIEQLTGSMSTPRVGNYIALVLLPCFALPWALPKRLPFLLKIVLLVFAAGAGLFLLRYSQTRTGQIAFICALAIAVLQIYKWKWWVITFTGVASGFVFLAQPGRLRIELLLESDRFYTLWPRAWEIFTNFPLFGTGINTYPAAVQLLHPEITTPYPHPHSIYMQYLAEGGIVGLSILLIFILGVPAWAQRRIQQGQSQGWTPRQTIPATFLWGGGICYAVEGLAAHNFFRTWWLGLAMCLYGAMVSSCLLEGPPQESNVSHSKLKP